MYDETMIQELTEDQLELVVGGDGTLSITNPLDSSNPLTPLNLSTSLNPSQDANGTGSTTTTITSHAPYVTIMIYRSTSTTNQRTNSSQDQQNTTG